MLVHIPDHFSSKFSFDFSKHPCSQTDRVSLLKNFLGILFGTGLFLLGGFELFSFLKTPIQNSQSMIGVEIFALIIIILSLCIIISSFLSILRYKKFYFDGNKFDIMYRSSIGTSYSLSAALKEYTGIRLRILSTPNNLIKKHKYIIDLYHNDSSKIIPLYISSHAVDLVRIWHGYAKAFNLPIISITERGVAKRECEDIDKNLKELFNEDKLPFIASGKLPAPRPFNIIENKSSTTIKTVKRSWDFYSYLTLLTSILSLLLLIGGTTFLVKNNIKLSLGYSAISAFVTSIFLYTIVSLFSSNCYDIDRSQISLKFCLGNRIIKECSISMDNIKNVELTYNSNSGRYGVAIVTTDEIYLIKERLHVNDVLWLKDFFTRKIVGN